MKILDLKEHQPPPRQQIPAIKIPTDLDEEIILISQSQERSSSFSPSIDSAFIKVDPIKKLRTELRKGSVISITGPLTFLSRNENVGDDDGDNDENFQKELIVSPIQTTTKETHFEKEIRNEMSDVENNVVNTCSRKDVENYSHSQAQHLVSPPQSEFHIPKENLKSASSKSPRCPRIDSEELSGEKKSPSVDICSDKNSLYSNPFIKKNCYNYITPDFIEDIKYIELPYQGSVMTTSSLCDILVVCSRIISFTQEVSDIVVPSMPVLTETQNYDKSTQDDLKKLRENNFGKVLSVSDTVINASFFSLEKKLLFHLLLCYNFTKHSFYYYSKFTASLHNSL